jgi:quinol-cytochrome oxidoreductase complex cytochrome b subunit
LDITVPVFLIGLILLHLFVVCDDKVKDKDGNSRALKDNWYKFWINTFLFVTLLICLVYTLFIVYRYIVLDEKERNMMFGSSGRSRNNV